MDEQEDLDAADELLLQEVDSDLESVVTLLEKIQELLAVQAEVASLHHLRINLLEAELRRAREQLDEHCGPSDPEIVQPTEPPPRPPAGIPERAPRRSWADYWVGDSIPDAQ